MFLRISLASALALWLPTFALSQTVDELVARNIAARGGAEAWRAVSSLRLTGEMEIGQGMRVPYVLEQKRPSKMRLEFVFDGETAVQCFDGKAGWKIAPFLGRTAPEPLSDDELREVSGSADPYGLLFDYAARGNQVELVGREPVEGRDAFKLKVTLPGGAIRWVYLDVASAYEVKIETTRQISGREYVVETLFRDWEETNGLLIPRRQETRTLGDDEAHVLTVAEVEVNPALDDSRFAKPEEGSMRP